MRHAELSRRMAVEIDPLTSAIAGYAHELDNSIPGLPPSWQIGSLGRHAQENWHGQRWPERRMDLHNNAEGRRAARQGRPVNSAALQIRPAQPDHPIAPYGEF